MEYVDFSALIQLGVVFNFAFIFEHLEPVKLFRKIFSNLNDDFKNKIKMNPNIEIGFEAFKL